MNLIKIGNFIATCRKKKKLTQESLAEQLGISNRAVSKWERGICLPDASIMILLCEILSINVNELLSGEMIEKKNYHQKAEENLLQLKEENERQIKNILNLELVIIFICILSIVVIFLAVEQTTNIYYQITAIVSAIIILAVTLYVGILIETKAGYYECKHCHHRYKPSYNQVLFAMHMGWTRYMKCPKCQKRSWNKKVTSK